MATKLLTPSNLKSVRFTVSGLDEYAQKVIKAGNSIDKAVAEAVEEIKESVREDIQVWADKHKMSGAVAESVNATEVKRAGNNIYADVGIDSNINPASWHAVFVEYGTPHQAADPGIRLAFDKWKRKSKMIFKKHLEKWGVPGG